MHGSGGGKMKRVLIALMLMCMCCNAVFAEGEDFSGTGDFVQGTVEQTPEDGEASENDD
jgi:predicted small secreted protein